jgi:AMP deaminase
VRWLIQVPRLYEEFKANKMINNMGEVISSILIILNLHSIIILNSKDIFAPLFEVTLNPASNPKLHKLLQSGKFYKNLI